MPWVRRSPWLPPPPLSPVRHPPLPQLLGGLLVGAVAQPVDGVHTPTPLLSAVGLLTLGSTSPSRGGSRALGPLHLRGEHKKNIAP